MTCRPCTAGAGAARAGQRRARARQEHLPFPEFPGEGRRRGAPEVVGGGDPRQEFQAGAGRVEAPREAAVCPRPRLVADEPDGRQVIPHQGAHPIDQAPRRPQPAEKAPRGRHPRPVVAGRAELLGDERFSEIVAEDREHERFVVRVAAAAKLHRPIEGEQGVGPYVALGVPARVLGHADEGLGFREVPHEAGPPEQIEADRGPRPEEQELAKLRERPLRRQLPEVEPRGQRDQLAVGPKLEAGRELRRPEPAQRVLREVRRIGHPEPLGGQVRPPAVAGPGPRR